MARTTVSLAKTTRPALSSVVMRERLFERLDAGIRHSTVWVEGPPGSGKTTLVGTYLEKTRLDHLWYQLDQGDNDVATFFYYMRHTGLKHSKDKSTDLPRFSSDYLGDISGFARRFFRALYRHLETPFVIVLDNYQEVPRQSNLHEVIRVGLNELPRDGALIFLSRMEPVAQMARYRANQEMDLITWDDLRLTPEETESMARLRGQSLSTDALMRLYTLTEGWAAGLVLLMERPAGGDLPVETPDPMTADVIFDYFAEETFKTFEQVTQDFLLQTSLLPRMTVSMVQELTGLAEAGQLLINLAHNNYFVSEQIQKSNREYQFHPLFREFLLNYAQKNYPEQRYLDLQRDAASVLLKHDQIEDAVEILIETASWELLADIIATHAASLLAFGRAEILGQWLDELPLHALQENPWLQYWLAAARFYTAPRESRQHYQSAFRAFETANVPDPRGLILSCCGAIDTVVQELDDLTLLDNWTADLEHLLDRYPEFLEGGDLARVISSMVMGMVLRAPHHPKIDIWMDRAYAIVRESSDQSQRLVMAPLTALAMLLVGRFSEAHEILDLLRELSTSTELQPPMLVTLRALESMDGMLRGKRETCIEAAREGLETAQAHGLPFWSNLLLAFAAGGALIDSDLETASDFLTRLEPDIRNGRRLEQCLYHYFSGWALSIRGDWIAAHQSLKTAQSLAVEVGMPFLAVICRCALAEVLYACGDKRSCTVMLSKMHSVARDIKNPLIEFMALLTFTHLGLEGGRTRAGLNSLRYAMGLGREQGYYHVLWWQPNIIASLCARALEEDIETEYVRHLISARRLMPDVPPLHIQAWPWRFSISAIGKFSFSKEGVAVGASPKSHGRPIELLKTIIAYGAKEVKAEHLAEALWPHVDSDYAYKSFTINLHRLRKLFGEDEAVLLQDGRVTLDPKYTWLDTWAFELVLGDIDKAFRQTPSRVSCEQIDELAERLFALYRGPFLEDEDEQPCYIAYREHLRNRLVNYLGKLTHFWEQQKDWERASACYERAIEADKYSESFYRHLMICYQNLGRRTDALDVYDRCRMMLSGTMQVSPSAETQGIYEELMQLR